MSLCRNFANTVLMDPSWMSLEVVSSTCEMVSGAFLMQWARATPLPERKDSGYVSKNRSLLQGTGTGYVRVTFSYAPAWGDKVTVL